MTPKQVTVDFPEAMKAVIQGDRVTKLEWNDRDIFGFLNNGFLMLHKKDGSLHQWIISDGDMFGQDWLTMKVN